MQIRKSLLASSMAAMMAATSVASAEAVSCANPMSAEEQQAHVQNMQNMSEQDRGLYRDRQYEILRERVREMGCPELPATPPWKTAAKTAPPAPVAPPPSQAGQEAVTEERRAEAEKAMEARRAEIQKQMEERKAEADKRMQERKSAAEAKQPPAAPDVSAREEEIAARRAAMQKQMEERKAGMEQRMQEREAL